MPIVYEVPTHLNVSDNIVFGLGAHQLVRLAAGVSLAYAVWDQASALPAELRATMAGLLAASGVACALVQPSGRPLDRWVLAALLFLAMPRFLAWRRVASGTPAAIGDGSGWAESVPELNWVDPATDDMATVGRGRP